MKRFNKRSKYIRKRKASKRKRFAKGVKTNASLFKAVKKVVQGQAEKKYVFGEQDPTAANEPTFVIGFGLQQGAGEASTIFPIFAGDSGEPFPLSDITGDKYMWAYMPMLQSAGQGYRVGNKIHVQKSYTTLRPIISMLNIADATTNFNYRLYAFEFKCTQGKFGPNGSTFINALGQSIYSNWGSFTAGGPPAATINAAMINNMCDLPMLFDTQNLGYQVHKVHVWNLPQICKSSVTNNYFAGGQLGRLANKKVLMVKRKQINFPNQAYGTEGNTLPLNTDNRVLVIVNDSPYTIGMYFNSYLSYTDI